MDLSRQCSLWPPNPWNPTVGWEVNNLRLIFLLVQIFEELILSCDPIFNHKPVPHCLICWMSTQWLARNRKQLSKWTLWLRDEPHKWNWSLKLTKKNRSLLKKVFFLKGQKINWHMRCSLQAGLHMECSHGHYCVVRVAQQKQKKLTPKWFYLQSCLEDSEGMKIMQAKLQHICF